MPNNKIEYVDINYDEIRRETDKAVLVNIDGDDYWFPKTTLSIVCCNDIENGDNPVTLKVAQWFADKEGFDYA